MRTPTDPPPASLCESCANMRQVLTPRSRFLLCEASAKNTDFPKYPRQPVVACDAYLGKAEGGGEKAEE